MSDRRSARIHNPAPNTRLRVRVERQGKFGNWLDATVSHVVLGPNETGTFSIFAGTRLTVEAC